MLHVLFRRVVTTIWQTLQRNNDNISLYISLKRSYCSLNRWFSGSLHENFKANAAINVNCIYRMWSWGFFGVSPVRHRRQQNFSTGGLAAWCAKGPKARQYIRIADKFFFFNLELIWVNLDPFAFILWFFMIVKLVFITFVRTSRETTEIVCFELWVKLGAYSENMWQMVILIMANLD